MHLRIQILSLMIFILSPCLLHCEEYWQQHVHYEIKATLDTDSNTIVGSEKLVYTNDSPDSLHEVYFHLYWNAYKKGSHGYKLARKRKTYYFDTSSGIELKKFSLVMTDAQYTPAYKIDDTILRASLPRPLAPGEKISFEIDWVGKIPIAGARTGYLDRDYNLGQWYPQIAVYDKYGWHTDQFTDEGEFHNDFGTFDVEITLPKSFILGHTGVLLNPEEVLPDSIIQKLEESVGRNEPIRVADYSERAVLPGELENKVTWKFHADDVRDFAWTANEYYVWDVAHWRDVRINALYSDGNWGPWKEVAREGRDLVEFFSRRFGQYLYPEIFIVEAVVSGGMEYPALALVGDVDRPGMNSFFGYVAHEIAHQWYPMMIGSNETEYAFQDEGFTAFITTRAVENRYGRYNNMYEWKEWWEKFFRFRNSDERTRNHRKYLLLAKTGYEEPVATHSDKFEEPALSETSLYEKTSAVLDMLEYVLGDSVFSAVMLEYYNRWKIKHPYPEDFFALAQEVSGIRDLRWFFDQWIYRTDQCDYALRRISTEKIVKAGAEVYRTSIRIKRIGKAIMPLDVELTMEDGSRSTISIPVDVWKNGEEEYIAVLDLPSKAKRGEINPDKRIADVNRLNNTYPWPRVDFRFDNTLFDPIDPFAYVIQWRPSLWYNDIDGMKLGAKLSGRYLDNLREFSAWSWIGTKNGRIDFDISGQTLLPYAAPLSFFSWRGFRIEGRQGLSAKFTKHYRRHYSYPPFHKFSVEFSHFNLKDGAYLLRANTWQTGLLNRLLLDYGYENHGEFWRVNARFNFEASVSIRARSQFNYSKRTFDFRFYLDLPEGWELATRFYNGRASGTVPIQTRYFLSGGSPIEEYNNPFFRSKGMLPSDIRDHALYPGGGNMRGFFNQLLYGDKIDAANFELRFPSFIPFVNTIGIPYIDRLLGEIRSVAFMDVGRVAFQDELFSDRRVLVDAGFGFRFDMPTFSTLFSSIGLSTLRVDFPLYVSSAKSGESRGKFRWIVGLSEAF